MSIMKISFLYSFVPKRETVTLNFVRFWEEDIKKKEVRLEFQVFVLFAFWRRLSFLRKKQGKKILHLIKIKPCSPETERIWSSIPESLPRVCNRQYSIPRRLLWIFRKVFIFRKFFWKFEILTLLSIGPVRIEIS